jgi:hypothetical protein
MYLHFPQKAEKTIAGVASKITFWSSARHLSTYLVPERKVQFSLG